VRAALPYEQTVVEPVEDPYRTVGCNVERRRSVSSRWVGAARDADAVRAGPCDNGLGDREPLEAVPPEVDLGEAADDPEAR
jgi:hypothetical protein